MSVKFQPCKRIGEQYPPFFGKIPPLSVGKLKVPQPHQLTKTFLRFRKSQIIFPQISKQSFSRFASSQIQVVALSNAKKTSPLSNQMFHYRRQLSLLILLLKLAAFQHIRYPMEWYSFLYVLLSTYSKQLYKL